MKDCLFACAIFLLVAACGGPSSSSTSEAPAATDAEVEVFCERYEQAKTLSFGEMLAEIEKVAPAQIRGELVRLINGPGEKFWDDKAVVDDFLRRCEPAPRS